MKKVKWRHPSHPDGVWVEGYDFGDYISPSEDAPTKVYLKDNPTLTIIYEEEN